MKKIVISLSLVLGLGTYLYADIKKPLDIHEFTKEIEKIQSVTKTKDDSIEMSKTINKLQNENTLINLQSSKLKPEAFLLEVNLISSKVATHIKELQTEIKSDSFILSNKGFEIDKTLYKRVAYEDIINAQNKVISKTKELGEYKKIQNFLATLKKKDSKFFYNTEVEKLLRSFKNVEITNITPNFQSIQNEKNYIDVKKGDVIAGVKIVEVTTNGIRIK